MKLEFDVSKASIVALSGPDEICLDLVTPVHGEYEQWNTSALYVRTARGNGEACLHALGWRGEYTYITSSGAETRQMLGAVGGMVIRHMSKDEEHRRIKDLSPEERTELARTLREWKEVID